MFLDSVRQEINRACPERASCNWTSLLNAPSGAGGVKATSEPKAAGPGWGFRFKIKPQIFGGIFFTAIPQSG